MAAVLLESSSLGSMARLGNELVTSTNNYVFIIGGNAEGSSLLESSSLVINGMTL